LHTDLREQRNFDKLYIQHPRRWVVAILLAYLLLATNFALSTPPWQAPDEPAHFNYVAHLATYAEFPVLQMGDYNQALLDLLQGTGFQIDSLIQQVRYESYQPPLFYLAATPIYWATGGSLWALRLFNVLLGAGVIAIVYRSLELVFPGKALITVSATAFVALLPMHVAVSAAVNNDVLAELLVVGSLLVLLTWMRAHFYPKAPAEEQPPSRRPLLWLGVLLGLGLLTKVYAYALLPICLVTIVAVEMRRAGSPFWQGVRTALWVAAPALLLGLPWWVRNWLVYGPWDILGTAWHDQVVVGQPRTLEWIASQGWDQYLERALTVTFRSFWGVFGWLGVFMDERIYTALLLFSGVIFLGVLWALVRLISGGPDMDMDDFQLWVLGLFALMVLAVFASYVWYNLKFVQHQGRYFFWGLLPLSTFVALGWREVLRPLQGLITALLTGVMAFSITLVGYTTGDIEKWTVVTALALALFLLCQPLLLVGVQAESGSGIRAFRRLGQIRWLVRAGEVLRPVAWAMPFLLLTWLNLLIPALFILPQLGG
jgi:4-amino-4-deoxy-L-arabinose transferase-like glycosyltransferase